MNPKRSFQLIALLYIVGSLTFLAAIAYLGTFTRHMSDDYCESYVTQTYSPLGAVVNRYEEGSWRAANRYSNLLFVGIMESLLGWRNIEIIPAVLVTLWAIGLIYLVHQVRKVAGIEWHIFMDILLGTVLAFFSILVAPNRFQTFYWRSSMDTHFTPLVFFNFVVASVFSRIRSSREVPPIRFILVLFFASFLIGGFSEPPVTVMIVGSGLGFAYSWFFAKGNMRRSLLILIGSILVGAVFALAVMALSPAVSKLGDDATSFVEWVQRTMQYTYFFMIDTFRALPLPIFFSIICPAIVVFVIYRGRESLNSVNLQTNRNHALTLPFILIILIAAGFSTSAYGQSFPVERARFFAHFLMTITLVFEGVLLGIWLSQVKWKFFDSAYFSYLPILILLLLSIYPFRAGLRVLQEVPAYSAREQAWDRRDAHIYKLRAQGQTDLIVPQFDGVDGVKELDNNPMHWVNRCAARYYGVNSISAVTMHGADAIEEYYGK